MHRRCCSRRRGTSFMSSQVSSPSTTPSPQTGACAVVPLVVASPVLLDSPSPVATPPPDDSSMRDASATPSDADASPSATVDELDAARELARTAVEAVPPVPAPSSVIRPARPGTGRQRQGNSDQTDRTRSGRYGRTAFIARCRSGGGRRRTRLPRRRTRSRRPPAQGRCRP